MRRLSSRVFVITHDGKSILPRDKFSLWRRQSVILLRIESLLRQRANAREEKLASFQQLTKLPGIQTAEQLAAASSNKARILIDHPHSYRDWIVVGKDAVPDFYHLKSAVWLDKFETTIFELCLHESQFERV